MHTANGFDAALEKVLEGIMGDEHLRVDVLIAVVPEIERLERGAFFDLGVVAVGFATGH